MRFKPYAISPDGKLRLFFAQEDEVIFEAAKAPCPPAEIRQ
jgi:hypothetical protein